MTADPTHPDPVAEVLHLFAERGRHEYHGEPVSLAEHALQTAAQAVAEGASDALVVAALLHDVGHLLHDQGESATHRGVDVRHEDLGADWLASRFGRSVSEPVRRHVAAKRYLCAVDPAYRDGLSTASLRSLGVQGGPFEPEERLAFEADPHHAAAVRLRLWDDAAKTPRRAVPDLDHYRARLEALRVR